MLGALIQPLVRRVAVTGDSMAPTVASGSRVTAIRRFRPLRPGDLVLVADPREPRRLLLKRCARVERGLVELRGDNATASTDSRDFGPVRARDVHWLVLEGPR